jgi:hypothetical protein
MDAHGIEQEVVPFHSQRFRVLFEPLRLVGALQELLG